MVNRAVGGLIAQWLLVPLPLGRLQVGELLHDLFEIRSGAWRVGNARQHVS